MNNCEHTIGMFYDYNNTCLISYPELTEYVKDHSMVVKYSIQDYVDRRKSTNLVHFNYCPNCGAKIDWNMMRRELNKEGDDNKCEF